MEIGTRVWVKDLSVTRGAEARVVKWPGNNRYGDNYVFVEFTGTGSHYVCPVKQATVIEAGTLIEMTAVGLQSGDVFYLTEDKKFRDVFKKFVTRVVRYGQPTVIRYVGQHDYRDEIVATTPVWLELEPPLED